MKRLLFWQNIPSIHQAPLLRAVASQNFGEVLVITEEDIPEQRLKQGWQRPDFSPCKLIISPTREQRRQLIAENVDEGAVHIFSGLYAYPETYWTLRQICRTKATVGVIVEPGRINEGFRSFLRRLRYTLHCLKWREKLDFLLATGSLGVRWYRSCLFPEKRIYYFGYFVDSQVVNVTSDEPISPLPLDNDLFKLLFVGQLIDRKGVDLLLNALHHELHRPWQLNIVGSGPQDEHYKTMARDLGLANRIQWHGVLTNSKVKELMAYADALVLPSRFDGWGAVINEALMAGAPAVVSNACGAADLVQAPWRGRVFQAGSVTSLREALASVIGAGCTPKRIRKRIREWSDKAIAPMAAAYYLLNIIRHVQQGENRPIAPWLNE